MTFKIVVIINLLLGCFQLIFPLIQLIFVIPKLSDLYQDFGGMPDLTITYILMAVIAILGIINIFFGIKLWSNSPVNKEKYFKYGIIFALVTFLVGSLIISFTVLSIISPIYNLSSQFK